MHAKLKELLFTNYFRQVFKRILKVTLCRYTCPQHQDKIILIYQLEKPYDHGPSHLLRQKCGSFTLSDILSLCEGLVSGPNSCSRALVWSSLYRLQISINSTLYESQHWQQNYKMQHYIEVQASSMPDCQSHSIHTHFDGTNFVLKVACD